MKAPSKPLVLLVFAIAALASEAQAACSTSLVLGNWSSVQTSLAGESHTGYCNFTITDRKSPQLAGTCHMQHLDSAGGDMTFPVAGPVTISSATVDNVPMCQAIVTMNFEGGSSTFVVNVPSVGTKGWVGIWSNTWGTKGISTAMKLK